jgi:hypothetical protein
VVGEEEGEEEGEGGGRMTRIWESPSWVMCRVAVSLAALSFSPPPSLCFAAFWFGCALGAVSGSCLSGLELGEAEDARTAVQAVVVPYHSAGSVVASLVRR